LAESLPVLLGQASAGTLGLEWILAALLLLILAAALLCWLHPALVFRVVLYLVGRSLYWVRRRGQAQVPRSGPALLVSLPLHGLDFLWLLFASPRRFRLFLCTGLPAQSWLARSVLRWMGAFVLDGNAKPEDGERLLSALRDALGQGELVCLFTERTLTRNGLSLEFARLLETIQRDRVTPIVPVCIDQAWGSQFHLEGDRMVWRWPQEVPYLVEVRFGPVLQTTDAGVVCRAIHALSAEAAIERNRKRPPIHRQFVRRASRRPFRSCLIDSTMKLELGYGKALAGAMCLANVLRPILGDSRMVALWLPPSIGGVLANVALALLGKTSVNLNYTSSTSAVQSALRQCQSRFVLTSKRFTDRVKLDPGPEVQALYLEDLATKITNSQRLRAFLSILLLPLWFLERCVLGLGSHRNSDLATVIFSSGSTGEPKGVMLTHGNVAANVESMIQGVQLDGRDRILGVLPFFHSFGFTVTLWAPLQLGASTVYHADPRQAREIGELCHKYRCTIHLTTPTFLRFCLRKCGEKDFQTLRLLICGAEKLPQSLALDFHQRFGVQVVEGYGCTELTPVVGTNLPDEEIGGVKRINNILGTIGPPIPGVCGRVLQPESRQELPTNQEGLVLIHGANVMLGYLHRPEQTSQVLVDGAGNQLAASEQTARGGQRTLWYVTGDMGRFDDYGYLTLTGRLSRFAKVGGEMVPLERIEDELHAILETSERICAVTCVPDDMRGERLIVLHVRHEGVEIRRWCQQLGTRGLPNLWLPNERDFIVVAELPVLGSGKVNLQRVKELALELARR
jgi:acyl-[acyl-carrier-protein]-phospholipid O-acyltransferase / long-chain-fatty-acid--[acyl-carrier-protein] ligase